MTKKIIKLEDPQILARVRQYTADKQASFDAATALQAEVEAKLIEMKGQFEEIHAQFWKFLAEVAPATTEGNWSIDPDYIDEGLVFLKQQDENEENGGGHSGLRSLLQALQSRGGVNVGIAEVNIRKQSKPDGQ